MYELIRRWRILNTQAEKILREHRSFKKYNEIRIKMDQVESQLIHIYGISIEDIEEDD